MRALPFCIRMACDMHACCSPSSRYFASEGVTSYRTLAATCQEAHSNHKEARPMRSQSLTRLRIANETAQSLIRTIPIHMQKASRSPISEVIQQ